MDEDWVGRAVSIECTNKLGVFQGIIKEVDATFITVVRAFRNGVPLRKQDAEITLRSCDIKNINFIQAYDGPMSVTPTVINKPTPVKQPNFLALNTLEHIEQQQLLQQPVKAPSKADMNALLQGSRNDCPPHWGLGVPQMPQPTMPPPLPNLALLSPLAGRPKFAASPTTPNKLNNNNVPAGVVGCGAKVGGGDKPSAANVSQFFNNMIPPKVELRLGATFLEPKPSAAAVSTASSNGDNEHPRSQSRVQNAWPQNGTTGSKPRSKSLSYNGHDGDAGGGGGGAGYVKVPNQKKQRQQQLRRENSCRENQTFGTSVDDPTMHEDFDFEGNLALFNKQAIWQRIDRDQGDSASGGGGGNGTPVEGDGRGKYRHDENILEGEPVELRQIHTIFESSKEFVTDEGLIIPSIPQFVRSKIETLAVKAGLSLQRQIDVLARGATDLAIMLLGGARRLTPNNCHQWPTIVIVCNQSKDMRTSLIGATTGRLLSSHGLSVVLYLEDEQFEQHRCNEIALYGATGNRIARSVAELPRPDLVILSTNSSVLQDNVRKWIKENRASILAVDTPPGGVKGISIKYSIMPLLPLNGIVPQKCGKLYLCNPAIPEIHYSEAGIKYKSPFGHKYVIPIHAKD